MRKLFLVVLVMGLLAIPSSLIGGQCDTAITAWKNAGLLSVRIDKDSAMAFVEPLMWKQLIYAKKGGLADCVLRVYSVSDVYIFPMGARSASSMLAAYNLSKGLRIY